ncbi:hypothetical protein PZA11_007620 [Diplocarpon coronariae]
MTDPFRGRSCMHRWLANDNNSLPMTRFIRKLWKNASNLRRTCQPPTTRPEGNIFFGEAGRERSGRERRGRSSKCGNGCAWPGNV